MGDRSRSWRSWASALITLLAVTFQAGCGARSSLPTPDPCSEAGTTRTCHDTCGQGEEVCQGGYWQACSVPDATRPCSSVCGAGVETCTDDAWGTCDAPLPIVPTLHATVRNIGPGQPDFLQTCCSPGGDDTIVADELGADGTPVYTGDPDHGTPTTHGAADFQSWYHDVPGVNLTTTFDLPFVAPALPPGPNVFDDEALFPVDGQLFGNQGADHNYDFTIQAHAQILYGGGETWSFSSDDDLWVFVNRRLAVDLGGLHSSESQSIELDQLAGELGLVTGQIFALDVFYANREPTGAVLRMSIPQSDLWSCP